MTDELLPALPYYGIDTANHARVRVLGYTGAQMRDYAREAIRLALENGLPVEVRDDARRYRKLKPMLIAADFDYDTGDERVCALVFQLPDDGPVSADLDSTLDELPSRVTGGREVTKADAVRAIEARNDYLRRYPGDAVPAMIAALQAANGGEG